MLFVVSVLNMAIQIPAHASMQQSMEQMPEMMEMTEGEMEHCKCPPAMCESVDSISDQSIENLSSVNFSYLSGEQPAYLNRLVDEHQLLSVILFNHHEWQYRQFSPPPLILSSILHI